MKVDSYLCGHSITLCFFSVFTFLITYFLFFLGVFFPPITLHK